MRADERPRAPHTALARMLWDAAPSVRLHYHRDVDTLVVEFAQADEVAEIKAAPHLLVDLDGTDPAARPVRLYLTGARAEPNSPSAQLARDLVGQPVWTVAQVLVGRGSGSTDVNLGPEQAADLCRRWRSRLVPWTTPAVIGVEFTPRRLYAALTNDRGDVLDEEVEDLSSNGVDDVVDAVVRVAGRLGRRHAGTAAAICPIAVQLGGPVHTPSGTVEHYHKALGPGETPWAGVPLGKLITDRTGRTVTVFNDARAFAELEIHSGVGQGYDKVVVMIVRHGVGAKLIHRGRIAEDFPLEFGVFLDELAPDRSGERRPIEARAGIVAITEGVELATGQAIATIADAADAADTSDDALEVFLRAGSALARAVAAVQAVIDPDRWILVAPEALTDRRRSAGRAFQQGLAQAHEHLGYENLYPGLVVPRSTTGSLGAVAAAVAALRRPPDKPQGAVRSARNGGGADGESRPQ